ncbi:hypothetical protein BIV57_18705 [Mangrovactinospora gilvigrisea]|uniref:DUF742 domain-containing protein n=1 Tax=Mangrovactinospora gilvigrisea TaxID=1428644 RepID=A0A1J7BBF8_9ACTN|nr:DUF742 domain-containing protein [Mangrovactinospora gilvigrisea]OIV36015.1 hypothetical protein BIV57_18705 [Mangrovactinospora gilvigrisea]
MGAGTAAADGGGRGGSARVRPYTITGGRTRVHRELNVETLVSVLTGGPSVRRLRTRPELAAICELCVRPHSVAEVSALIRVPLGVARVLIGDLVDQGRLRVHGLGPDADPNGSPDKVLLERVLGGLRRL